MAQGFKIDPNWKLILCDLGVEPGDVLRRAELPADLLARESVSVSAREYFRLWSGLEEEMGERPVALEIGQKVTVESFNPPVFAALCSPDLNVAAERLGRFKRLVGPFTLDVDIGPEETVLAYGSTESGLLPASLGAMELVFLVRFARLATRTKLRPQRVTTPDDRGDV